MANVDSVNSILFFGSPFIFPLNVSSHFLSLLLKDKVPVFVVYHRYQNGQTYVSCDWRYRLRIGNGVGVRVGVRVRLLIRTHYASSPTQLGRS